MAETLVKGIGIGKNKVTGKVAICISEEDYHGKIQNGDIVVLPGLENEYVPFVTRHAAAIVTEEGGLTSDGAIVAITLKLTVVVGAEGAISKLKDGQIVTVDPVSGIVYEGTVE